MARSKQRVKRSTTYTWEKRTVATRPAPLSSLAPACRVNMKRKSATTTAEDSHTRVYAPGVMYGGHPPTVYRDTSGVASPRHTPVRASPHVLTTRIDVSFTALAAIPADIAMSSPAAAAGSAPDEPEARVTDAIPAPGLVPLDCMPTLPAPYGASAMGVPAAVPACDGCVTSTSHSEVVPSRHQPDSG